MAAGGSATGTGGGVTTGTGGAASSGFGLGLAAARRAGWDGGGAAGGAEAGGSLAAGGAASRGGGIAPAGEGVLGLLEPPTLRTEIVDPRYGLVTFPGELTVQIGLNIKKNSPHKPTFVAGYTNGYIYYCPTVEQLANRGHAQEDSDCIVAPGWQKIFENKALEMLRKL